MGETRRKQPKRKVKLYSVRWSGHMPDGLLPLSREWFWLDETPLPIENGFVWTWDGTCVRMCFYFWKHQKFIHSIVPSRTNVFAPRYVDNVLAWRQLPAHPCFCGGPGFSEYDLWIPAEKAPDHFGVFAIALEKKGAVMAAAYDGARILSGRPIWRPIYPLALEVLRIPSTVKVTHYQYQPEGPKR